LAVTVDSRLEGKDSTPEEIGRDAAVGVRATLGVIDDTGVTVNDAASSGIGDGSATLEDSARLLRVCVGVLAGTASGKELIRLTGVDKYSEVGV
jgi:hypothetical protein